ncbi:helix-turn-helix domain-containing protein [Methylobacterium thuringiense]|uniref:Helix-turn-helix domain-containing protein n=1 Tax=Methylobacterium thuringiense TaxID=1003091 RepID=A0ABQ4TSQ1_9HYPH|nr:helix-turn-helix domain-containing protein [Methylobacterium thuringiense]GJE56948.1 hypothetical protein EKPJFOCH_3458 [Methylobacterium thuringiense]
MKLAAGDPYSYRPRGLGRVSAARYLGIDESSFDNLVKIRKLSLPRRLNGTPVWDRHQLEAAFETFPNDEGDASATSQTPKPFTPHPKVYTPGTLAKRWKCSGTLIRNMIKRGELPAFKFGGKLLRIQTADVVAYESGAAADAKNRSAT